MISMKALDREGYYTSFGGGKCKITKRSLVMAKEYSSFTTFYQMPRKLCKKDVNAVDDSSTNL